MSRTLGSLPLFLILMMSMVGGSLAAGPVVDSSGSAGKVPGIIELGNRYAGIDLITKSNVSAGGNGLFVGQASITGRVKLLRFLNLRALHASGSVRVRNRSDDQDKNDVHIKATIDIGGFQTTLNTEELVNVSSASASHKIGQGASTDFYKMKRYFMVWIIPCSASIELSASYQPKLYFKKSGSSYSLGYQFGAEVTGAVSGGPDVGIATLQLSLSLTFIEGKLKAYLRTDGPQASNSGGFNLHFKPHCDFEINALELKCSLTAKLKLWKITISYPIVSLTLAHPSLSENWHLVCNDAGHMTQPDGQPYQAQGTTNSSSNDSTPPTFVSWPEEKHPNCTGDCPHDNVVMEDVFKKSTSAYLDFKFKDLNNSGQVNSNALQSLTVFIDDEEYSTINQRYTSPQNGVEPWRVSLVPISDDQLHQITNGIKPGPHRLGILARDRAGNQAYREWTMLTKHDSASDPSDPILELNVQANQWLGGEDQVFRAGFDKPVARLKDRIRFTWQGSSVNASDCRLFEPDERFPYGSYGFVKKNLAEGGAGYSVKAEVHPDAYGTSSPCPSCSGGSCSASNCDSGDCDLCNGSGRIRLQHGLGTQDCPTCNGSGECGVCSGSGNCTVCTGSGASSNKDLIRYRGEHMTSAVSLPTQVRLDNTKPFFTKFQAVGWSQRGAPTASDVTSLANSSGVGLQNDSVVTGPMLVVAQAADALSGFDVASGDALQVFVDDQPVPLISGAVLNAGIAGAYVDTANFSDGPHVVSFLARDMAGNRNLISKIFRFDNRAPTQLTWVQPKSGATFNTYEYHRKIQVAVSDSRSKDQQWADLGVRSVSFFLGNRKIGQGSKKGKDSRGRPLYELNYTGYTGTPGRSVQLRAVLIHSLLPGVGQKVAARNIRISGSNPFYKKIRNFRFSSQASRFSSWSRKIFRRSGGSTFSRSWGRR
ncbi:MAG: hypothetical protein QF752_01060 [Planctomycetota bacterium]|jgi:hypothetical protein|nr:hypothetical protein [Planctomycetota bacterium]